MTSYQDLKSFITEAVSDIDIRLKAAGYDMFSNDKTSGRCQLERVRRKVKALEEGSLAKLKVLESRNNELEKQLRIKVNKEFDMHKENERLKNDINILKQEAEQYRQEIKCLKEETDDYWMMDLNDSVNASSKDNKKHIDN